MIAVKYFGSIAEKTKSCEEEIPLSQGFLDIIVNELKQKYDLNNLVFSIAVNQKLIQNWENYELKSNDIIAFLPPFAGG